MGWASASGVFNKIFEPLRTLYDEGKMPAQMLKDVAKNVIEAFEDCDWDTQDESLEEFAECAPIVEAFKEVDPEMFEEHGCICGMPGCTR